MTKHFDPRYHPRKRVLDTVSPKKTIAGYCITQENRPPALDETFPTYVSPKVSPKKAIARYCITQENRPLALDETFPNYVSPKKTGPGHGITQENNCWLLYHPRKRVLDMVSPKKTIAGYCMTQENRPPALDETF